MAKHEWKEKDLEDYIHENPKELFEVIFPFGTGDSEIGLLGRQVECAHGIIDLMYYVTLPAACFPTVHVYILELKAVPANRKTIEQVLRYRQALKNVNFYMLMGMEEVEDLPDDIYDFVHFEPVIVAPSFGNDTDWFGDRILTEMVDGNFRFQRQKYNLKKFDTQQTINALQPAVDIAVQSMRKRKVSETIRRGWQSMTSYAVGDN